MAERVLCDRVCSHTLQLWITDFCLCKPAPLSNILH